MGRNNYVFCVVKSAVLRDENGNQVKVLPFGTQFKVLQTWSDGRYYGETIRTDYNGTVRAYERYKGFVRSAGFSKYRVFDMAGLLYRNKMGKRIPVSLRYRGDQDGWIEPNTVLKASASVDGWMLTDKGWTKSEWLAKVRDIDDPETMKNLVYAVITQTVSDYKRLIRRFQTGFRYVPGEYTDSVAELMIIRQWFQSGNYLKIFEDSMTGEERLQMLDNELGVTEEWIKMISSKVRIKLRS